MLSLSFPCHPFSLFKNIPSFSAIALSALPSLSPFSLMLSAFYPLLISVCASSFIPASQCSSSVTWNFHNCSCFSVHLGAQPLDAALLEAAVPPPLVSALPSAAGHIQHHGCRSLQVFKCPGKIALAEVELVVQKVTEPWNGLGGKGS